MVAVTAVAAATAAEYQQSITGNVGFEVFVNRGSLEGEGDTGVAATAALAIYLMVSLMAYLVGPVECCSKRKMPKRKVKLRQRRSH